MGSLNAVRKVRRLAGFSALILCGASVGTLLRATISQAFPHDGGQWPWATFVINIVGSFLLGALLEGLANAGGDTGWRRMVRLTAGTGVMGGFTTYSTYVVEIVRLEQSGFVLTAVTYGLVSIVVGVAAAGAGIAATAWVADRIRPRTEEYAG